jgi:hypothetical protein
VSRRRFLQGAAAVMAAPLVVPASALGLGGAVAASNRITFANIGIGARARYVMPFFLAQRDIVFVAVSDCRESQLKSAKTPIDTHYGNQDCRMYPDFRELLAQKDMGLRLGRKLRWDPVAERFDCEEANRMMRREPRAPWCI